jgi:hypothetical protein
VDRLPQVRQLVDPSVQVPLPVAVSTISPVRRADSSVAPPTVPSCVPRCELPDVGDGRVHLDDAVLPGHEATADGVGRAVLVGALVVETRLGDTVAPSV